jgi:hypothetical protein
VYSFHSYNGTNTDAEGARAARPQAPTRAAAAAPGQCPPCHTRNCLARR